MSFDDGGYSIALADGAGSSRFSHYGASLVVEHISSTIHAHFDEAFGSAETTALFKRRLVEQMQISLYSLAKVGINFTDLERKRHDLPSRQERLLIPCSLSDLACTALCVVVQGNKYVAVHIGDGVIGIQSSYGKTKILRVLSHPDNGEFANETCFITSEKASRSARLITGRIQTPLRTIDDFILMSDGPEAALYDKRKEKLAPACSKLFKVIRTMEKDIASELLEQTLRNAISRKTNDDCSIAIMSKL